MASCQDQSAESYTPGLGELMTATQMRHTKLWFAGQANNWQLADYELKELEEGFDDATKFHAKRTELLAEMIAAPMKQLEEAVVAKSQNDFKQAYDDLPQACNACHQATEFGFNVVITPTSNPYANQSFQVEK